MLRCWMHGLHLSIAGEFMVRYFELVLNLPQSALQKWVAQRQPGHGAHSSNELDAALTEALAGIPGLRSATAQSDSQVASACDNSGLSTPCRDQNGRLAAEGLQMLIETVPRGRRIAVVKRARSSPAVCLSERVYGTVLEADAPSANTFDDAPHTLKKTLTEAGDLAPVSAQAYARACWQWQGDNGVTVEIAFEHGTASTNTDEAASPRELRLCAAYVEGGTEAGLAALFSAAHALVASLPAFPLLRSARDGVSDEASQPESDAQSGAKLEPKHEPKPTRAKSIDLSGLSTPQDALSAISGNITEHWFGNDAGVRDEINAEFVHQLRVSQRRLKTAMRIFSPWTDDVWETRLKPELKWLGSTLGEARDWDVFAESTLPALAAADGNGERWTPTLERANQRRLEARERVQIAVASTRYAQLALGWLEWLSALPSREPPAKDKDLSLHAYAKKRVRKYYERLVSAPKLTTISDEARHKERIHAKYLRYTLEFFDSIASRKTRTEFAKTVSRLQSVLGDGNDVAVALGYLDTLEVEPYQAGFARGWTEAAKRYTAQEGERLLRSLGKPKLSTDSAD